MPSFKVVTFGFCSMFYARYAKFLGVFFLFLVGKRRTYRKERQKVRKATSSQAASEGYAGKWAFFSAMRFLDAVPEPKHRSCSRDYGSRASSAVEVLYFCALLPLIMSENKFQERSGIMFRYSAPDLTNIVSASSRESS